MANDTFVTMSSKRSVATHFGFHQMDAGHAAQIYGRPIMLIAHFGLRHRANQAWKDISSELDLLAR